MNEFADNTNIWESWHMTTKRMLKAASKAGVPNRLTLHYDTVVYIRAESLAQLLRSCSGSHKGHGTQVGHTDLKQW